MSALSPFALLSRNLYNDLGVTSESNEIEIRFLRQCQADDLEQTRLLTLSTSPIARSTIRAQCLHECAFCKTYRRLVACEVN